MEIGVFISLLTHTTAPVGPAEILRFELSIDAKLPADYRKFLSVVNGGSLPSDRYPNLLAFKKDRLAALSDVFGFRDEPHFSLFWHIENLGVPLPDGLIGIMNDGNGNLICLDVSGSDYGTVHIRDGGDIYFLADSFSDFISGVRFWHEIYPETADRA